MIFEINYVKTSFLSIENQKYKHNTTIVTI